ncbi:hypothetical protein PFICI_10530 [Pestalotiopsis fici W106-1]|uniref:DUF8035 domain-containing protein n=1 Tax=Pestalotiopsis fici (strain W106-1 / CGMCC3.15140) TaxID=1229662 RepID=W3WX65_PESFW|nr:uncharacterized protein PFICI_10530 [Pestalotiopsis fici W106-1]ETS78468.1 hypothetical protein PFICI_10530 [Pestalotiopsis fici W106-1]
MKGEVVATLNQSPYIFNHSMADPRYRHASSGRRSPTFHHARSSVPTNLGYNYSGDIHAVPTGRYDTTALRRTGEHSHHRPATTTITTYNVTKEPTVQSTTSRDPSRSRHRSSTFTTGSVKPIIVTTNHSRPHNPSSHASSVVPRRPESPGRDPYRSSEETYYSQPASSIRSRSHQRHNSTGYDHESLHRMRERIGAVDDRLRAPVRTHNRAPTYSNLPRGSSADYAMDDYEYTKPSDLARYDLDHERPRSRNGRRDSIDRGNNYYRPSVNVVSHDYSARPAERRPPPTSGALDRYNRNAAAGIYERGAAPIPNLPAAPASPLVDPRRSGLLERPSSPANDRRTSRPRPVSLYQDPSPRMDDLSFRARDDNLHHERRDRERERERERDRERDRDEAFRDEAVSSRGFGIRSDLIEPTESRRPTETERVDRRDLEEYRPHRDYDSREPKRRSDESLDKSRGRHERRSSVIGDRQRIEESRDRKDGKGEKMRDKVAAGLSVAAAAIGLGNAGKEKEKDDKDGRVSPRRRMDSELANTEAVDSRHTDRYKPRDVDIERRSSPREDALYADERKERHERRDDSSSRERERQRERDRKEKEREKDRSRRDQEASTSGSKREDYPHSDDAAAAAKRRQRSSAAFDPTDTKGLMDLKAELAAIDPGKSKEKDKPVAKERTEPDVIAADLGRDREREREREPRDRDRDRANLDRARDESRGRELALVDAEQKSVRVVSPPRDKADSKPIKGILKQPTSQFPEDANPIREGVAPHKDDKTKKDVPAGARWTKINRRMVNPEALTIGKERFEVRDDFVIVLRVLSKEEIQAYATATAQLREMRRKEYEREHGDRDSDRDRDRDADEHRKRHRHRRDRDDDDIQDKDRDDDREHSRRHRRDDEDDKPRAIEYDDHSRHHHRSSHRDRERDMETISDDRR